MNSLQPVQRLNVSVADFRGIPHPLGMERHGEPRAANQTRQAQLHLPPREKNAGEDLQWKSLSFCGCLCSRRTAPLKPVSSQA